MCWSSHEDSTPSYFSPTITSWRTNNLVLGSRKGFIYVCSSCKIAFHLKCSLLRHDTYGNFIEIFHLAHPHPLLLIGNHNYLLQRSNCSGCSTKLVDDSYGCFHCVFFSIKNVLNYPLKSVTLATENTNLCFSLSWIIVFATFAKPSTQDYFIVVRFVVLTFMENVLGHQLLLKIKKNHEHPFTLLSRPNSFTCDACGTQGENVLYICSTFNIQVHKDCIPFPRFIRLNLQSPSSPFPQLFPFHSLPWF